MRWSGNTDKCQKVILAYHCNYFLTMCLVTLKGWITGKKQWFSRIKNKYGIPTGYRLNAASIQLMKDIFERNVYGRRFPFNHRNIILDLGAHQGYFALFAAYHSLPGSRIICVEPDEQNFFILQRNMKFVQSKEVVLINKALASTNGTRLLFKGNSQNHSLFPVGQNPLSTNTAVSAETIMLDQLLAEQGLEQVDFLKMDIEGAEYEVLLNTAAGVLKKIAVICLEFHDLRSAGYSGEQLRSHLLNNGFTIDQFEYHPSNMGLQFGMLVALRHDIARK